MPAAQPGAPAEKKTNPLLYVGIGCAALLVLSCILGTVLSVTGVFDGDDESSETSSNTTTETGGGGGGGGGTVCQRAQTCCNDYVAALGGGVSADQACAGVAAVQNAPGADQSCQTMINQWRTALQTAQRTVPASCQ